MKKSNTEEHPAPTPSIRRLNRQLRVDFATDVRVSVGKRKREPTRSVYEEAAANMAKDTQKQALKKQARQTQKRIRRKQQRPSSTKSTLQSEDQHQLMLHAAASLAQMSRTGKPAVAHDKPTASEKTTDFITKAHSDALLAAKDQAIRAANAALAAREELVRVQATLIAIMQQNAAATLA